MERKRFTVDEANRILPLLREEIVLIQDRMKWLSENPPRLDYVVEQYRIPSDSPVPRDYFTSLLLLRRALGRLEALGCQLKDVGKGLVDFPSRLGGKEVLLCWSLGEESVSYYHDPRAGYAGRQPIPGGPEDPNQGGEDGPSGRGN